MKNEGTTPRRRGLWTATMLAASVGLTGCAEGLEAGDLDSQGSEEGFAGDADEDSDDEEHELPPGEDPMQKAACEPTMTHYPVAAPHNTGWDPESCPDQQPCAVSCPDANANSDHHDGIDIFAHHRAPLVATADGVIQEVGIPSDTSGIRVRLRDACGWEYYYGHMDEEIVHKGQQVKAGDVIGYMGATGTSSTHLHFNLSHLGGYYDGNGGRDPISFLRNTSATACGGAEPLPPAAEPPPPPEGCGVLGSGEALFPGEILFSCNGRFQMQMQTDGNIVMRVVDYVALWTSETHGTSPSGLVMQEDGNLVLYGKDGGALWNISTHGNPGAYLTLQDDGNLVVYRGNDVLWSTGTGQ